MLRELVYSCDLSILVLDWKT